MKNSNFGWLRILNPEEGKPNRFPLINERKKSNVIGRRAKINAPEANIILDTTDKTISRKHCQIDIRMNKLQLVYLISDLGSLSGTLIYKEQNSQQMISLTKGDLVYIDDQDIIQIGNLRLKIELPL